jgi:hypothetical protein
MDQRSGGGQRVGRVIVCELLSHSDNDPTQTCQQVMEMSSGEAMNALRQLVLRRRYLNLGWRRHALRRR